MDIKNKLRAAGSVSLLIIILGASAETALAAAQYPPTFGAPTVGDRLIDPVTPKHTGTQVVVPVVIADNIPLTSMDNPTSVSSLKLRVTSPVPNSSNPVAITGNLILDGVAKNLIVQTPLASVSAKTDAEIQVASQVPTRVQITSLAQNANAVIRVLVSGKSINLGSLKTNSKGTVVLPPLTFTGKSSYVTIQIVVGGKSYSYIFRSTK